jgi:predicted small metal-binding protein
MAKILECARVDPSSGCTYVARGETEEDILRNVAVHAREHGIHEVTPELIGLVKANIRDAA